jgi:hypothetical protein
MSNTKLLFTISIFGLTALTAVVFVLSRLVLVNQPEVEGIVSIIWTIAFIVALYKILGYFFATKETSHRQQRQNLLGALSFLFETLAMVVLLIVAIQFAFTMTADNNATLLAPIAVSFLCVLAVPASFRLVRLLSQRSQRLKANMEPSEK